MLCTIAMKLEKRPCLLGATLQDSILGMPLCHSLHIWGNLRKLEIKEKEIKGFDALMLYAYFSNTNRLRAKFLFIYNYYFIFNNYYYVAELTPIFWSSRTMVPLLLWTEHLKYLHSQHKEAFWNILRYTNSIIIMIVLW